MNKKLVLIAMMLTAASLAAGASFPHPDEPTTMSSGRKLSGGVSRCYPFFAEFKECLKSESLVTQGDGARKWKNNCWNVREDYLECLHAKKESAMVIDLDEDSNPTSTSPNKEVLGSFQSSSNSEEGIRRYLRSNGMGRRLPQKLTNETGYMCDPSFWNCMVVADTSLIPSSDSEITGIVLGCVVAVGGAIVLGLAWYKYKRRQSRCSNSKEEAADDRTYVSNLTQEALEMEVI